MRGRHGTVGQGDQQRGGACINTVKTPKLKCRCAETYLYLKAGMIICTGVSMVLTVLSREWVIRGYKDTSELKATYRSFNANSTEWAVCRAIKGRHMRRKVRNNALAKGPQAADATQRERGLQAAGNATQRRARNWKPQAAECDAAQEESHRRLGMRRSAREGKGATEGKVRRSAGMWMESGGKHEQSGERRRGRWWEEERRATNQHQNHAMGNHE